MDKLFIPATTMIVLILGLAFYWFEWRPIELRVECGNKATDFANGKPQPPAEMIEAYMKICIMKSGIIK